jgi:ketosteroid isomerase-like protein
MPEASLDPALEGLVREAYAAFNARDIHGALALMAPDVQWPNGMEGGYVHGHAGVRDYWERQWQLIDPRVAPVAFTLASDGRLVVEVDQTIRDRAGVILSQRLVEHIYRFHDGRIVDMEIREPASRDD